MFGVNGRTRRTAAGSQGRLDTSGASVRPEVSADHVQLPSEPAVDSCVLLLHGSGGRLDTVLVVAPCDQASGWSWVETLTGAVYSEERGSLNHTQVTWHHKHLGVAQAHLRVHPKPICQQCTKSITLSHITSQILSEDARTEPGCLSQQLHNGTRPLTWPVHHHEADAPLVASFICMQFRDFLAFHLTNSSD